MIRLCILCYNIGILRHIAVENQHIADSQIDNRILSFRSSFCHFPVCVYQVLYSHTEAYYILHIPWILFSEHFSLLSTYLLKPASSEFEFKSKFKNALLDLSHSFTFFRLFFINVYMVLFPFSCVIYVFLLLWLCILIVCLCMTTMTEVFPCFFLSCKANAKVKPAKTGHGPHSS